MPFSLWTIHIDLVSGLYKTCLIIFLGIFTTIGNNQFIYLRDDRRHFLSSKVAYIHANKWNAVLCLVAQSCLILSDPMDGSPPGSSIVGILQARTLEWVSMRSSISGI